MDGPARRDTLRPFHNTDAPSSSQVSGHVSRQPWHPDASMLEFSDDSTYNGSICETESESNIARDDEDPDEQDDVSATSRMSMLGPKMRFHSPAPWETDGDFLADVDPIPKKHFPFGPSSPRPSGESSRSKFKKSLEVDKARSQLHALAQASTQPNSNPSSYHRPAAKPHIPSTHPSFCPPSPDPTSLGLPQRSSHASVHESVHPFANPELAYFQNDPPPSPALSTFSQIPTRAVSGIFNAFERTPTTPPSTKDSDPPPSSLRKWEISSPLAIPPVTQTDGDPLQPRVTSWMPRTHGSDPITSMNDTTTPAFHLISLEEAREKRKHSIATDSASVISGPSVEHDRTSSSSTRTRARSVSAGAKAKTVLQSMVAPGSIPSPERRDSEPTVPGTKTLKHRKSSGFMRLFNAQKERDEQPPPVPILSETYSMMNAKVASSSSSRPAAPSIFIGQLDSSKPNEAIHDSPSSPSSPKHLSSPARKTVPSLSIKTDSPAPPPPIQSAVVQTLSVTPSGSYNTSSDTLPKSAPANVAHFPALRLRPVSTAFSSQFGEQFISRNSQPSLDPDISASSSPTSAVSLLTPSLTSRSILNDQDKLGSSTISPHAEDQSAVIQGLQEQIVSAKKAWQRHIWELEGQVRDLKVEVEDLRTPNRNGDGYCEHCGRGGRDSHSSSSQTCQDSPQPQPYSVINRPRARTRTSSPRFGGVV